jgi:uncharacterized protein
LSISSVDSASARPWRRVGADGSVTLAIHAQPGAKRSEVAGVHGDSLKIRLAASAVESRANAELIAFLADAFAVPEHAVTLVRGARSRRKIVRIAISGQRPDLAWGK